MRILIVEDDENKRRHLSSFILSELPQPTITEARSYQSGLRRLLEGPFDLVLLDIDMPTFDIGVGEDGGRPQPFGGREILRQMRRRKIVLPVVVVTQFDRFGAGEEELTLAEISRELQVEHSESYRGTVYYDASLASWKAELHEILSVVLNSVCGSEE